MAKVRKDPKYSSPKNPGLAEFLALNRVDTIDALSTEGQVFFELITLIVNIKYRNKYGNSLDIQHGRGYRLDMSDIAVAGQITPADNGLLRL